MPNQVDGNIAKQRLKVLNDKINEKNKMFRIKNQPLDILVESSKNGIYKGYDQFFNPMEIKSDVDLVGDWINIKNYEKKENCNVSKF
jgi:tRNA A37 methylthiotransferase MiaB